MCTHTHTNVYMYHTHNSLKTPISIYICIILPYIMHTHTCVHTTHLIKYSTAFTSWLVARGGPPTAPLSTRVCICEYVSTCVCMCVYVSPAVLWECLWVYFLCGCVRESVCEWVSSHTAPMRMRVAYTHICQEYCILIECTPFLIVYTHKLRECILHICISVHTYIYMYSIYILTNARSVNLLYICLRRSCDMAARNEYSTYWILCMYHMLHSECSDTCVIVITLTRV